MNERHNTIRISTDARTIVSIDDFSFVPNDVTFLFGESGIGKSILSKAVYGLHDPDELTVEMNGRPYHHHLRSAWVREVQKNSFFVFQEPSSHLNSLMKITEQLTEGSLCRADNEEEILHHLWQTTRDDAIRRILDIYPKPYRPSGGEKQRVLLAMAFKKITIFQQVNEPERPTFFVFDEPTGSLDDNYRNVFLEFLFRKYAKQPFTVMFITHDYSIISVIYKKYTSILDRIHFKELTRQSDTRVSIHDFSADDYLRWLDHARPAPANRRVDNETPVLQVAGEFAIFNRSHAIYRDPGHTQPCDFHIQAGEMSYLKAPSGVGKTTLAKIVMGLYAPQTFSMHLCGMRITERTGNGIWRKKIWGKKAGMVFQHADESLNLQATVKEVFGGLPTKRKITTDVLKLQLMELFEGEITESFLNKRVGLLSGGQKQRLNLLRTLILDTDLVILDEPLNGLDFASIRKVLSILEEKRRDGTALLVISHNEEIFDHIVDPGNVYYLA